MEKVPRGEGSSKVAVETDSTAEASIKQFRIIPINHCDVNNTDNTKVIEPINHPDNRVVTSKYTVLNFIPKNLFEQFRRIANFYFLCIAVIQVTTNSPVHPITSLVPLIFVVTTTALKQAYEDWLRHRGDNAVNNRNITVLVKESFIELKSQQIRVGDIVMCKNNDEISCDLVILSSSDPEGKCHVTTANLDGETNLKVRDSPKQTINYTKAEDFACVKGFVECDKPNTDLYEFNGNLKLEQSGTLYSYSLGPNNLLLRGARLKNTDYIFGVAVYTGQDTKMALNSRLTSNKFSSVERTVNKYLLAYLAILLIASSTCTIFRCSLRNDKSIGKPWYLQGIEQLDRKVEAKLIGEEFLSFFVIFNYLIPISLYVTLEMVKFFGSKTLVSDPKLMDEVTGEKPICNSSDLNEELGQVEYLFSDKTGTLTENKMKFRACSIDGFLYEEKDQLLYKHKLNGELEIVSLTPDLKKFFLVLAVCNTAQVTVKKDCKPSSKGKNEVENDSYIYEYQAASPDEKALVEAAHRFSVTLSSASERSCEILVGSTTTKYKKLHVFEFDSTRKRMSVILQDQEGKIFLACKGAETALYELLKGGKIVETYAHIDEYAQHGLRTLVIAIKEFTPEEYKFVNAKIDLANSDLLHKKENLESVYNEIEANLTLLGATAIEDRLQEGVPETISDLKKAGIKVWVLTGDKLETAVSVAFSCLLLEPDMIQLPLARQHNPGSCETTLNKYLEDFKSPKAMDNKYAFVTDGRSLYLAMKHYQDKLYQVCQKCTVVLCCRMSPIQKAEVVHMIKFSSERPVTAAIGDGANDVSMIQEAHVGFGLMGLEGRQAVNSCDFAFSKFKYVRRILLVHGHLFYIRVSTLIHYFFYKNVVFVTPQFIYSFYNAFSAQTLYHGTLLMLFNMLFTAAPIMIYGIIERHIPAPILDFYPELYQAIKRNTKMSVKQFFKWLGIGIFHGLIGFFTFTTLWGGYTSHSQSGQFDGLYAFGTMIYHGIMLIVTFKLGIITRYWNFYFTATMALSILAVPTFCLFFSNFKWNMPGMDDELFGVYNHLVLSYSFWLSLLIVPVIALLPDVFFLVVRNSLNLRQFSDLIEIKRKVKS